MTEHTNEIDDAVIDRMVDGELDDVRQRELLFRMDDEPGGWRRLASGLPATCVRAGCRLP